MGWYPCSKPCESCIIFTDDFNRADTTGTGTGSGQSDLGENWSERGGIWTISSNLLRCTSVGDVLYSVPRAEAATGIRVTCELKFSATTDKVLIYIDYQDETTFLAARVNRATSRLELVDGAGTVLDYSGITVTTNTWYTLTVCWRLNVDYDSQSICAARLYPTGGGLTDYVVADFATPVGTYVGLGVDAVASNVYFDNFQYEYTEEQVAGCDPCVEREGCLGCEQDTESMLLKVVIPQFVEEGCRTAYSGTWLLIPMPLYASYGKCEWFWCETQDGYTNCIEAFFETIDTITYFVVSTTRSAGNHVRWRVAVTVTSTETGVPEIDCMQFNNTEVPLHYNNAPSCTITGDSSAYVTSLA